jgi:hypothetical protein
MKKFDLRNFVKVFLFSAVLLNGLDGRAFALDVTSPTISSVTTSTTTSASTVITWYTNEPSNSQILFGKTATYGQAAYDGAYVNTHRIQLLGLLPNTTYHFQVKSKDRSSNMARTEDRTFTTRTSQVAATSTYDLYVSPRGSDAYDGSEPTYAVLTLNRAQQILRTINPSKNIRVIINPGYYYKQTVVWSYTRPQFSITFSPPAGSTSMPVFDGCSTSPVTDPAIQCRGGTAFTLWNTRGEATNVKISKLRFQNYQTALVFTGYRDDVNSYNKRNIVEGCLFYKLGNAFNPALPYSTGAVRIVNSRENSLINNVFSNIINTTGINHLHSIYLAHNSSGNIITGNTFKYTNGDPIRVRDASGNNVISGNTGIRAGEKNFFEDWYCTSAAEGECTKEGPECPSWNNQLSNNTIGLSYTGETIAPYMVYLSNFSSGCPLPSSGVSRVISK